MQKNKRECGYFSVVKLTLWIKGDMMIKIWDKSSQEDEHEKKEQSIYTWT